MKFFTQTVQNLFNKAFGTLTIVAMLGMSAAPMTAYAAANYVISGSVTQNGLTVSANGVASATPYTGQGTAQFISVSWNFVGSGSVYETVKDHTALNFLNNDKSSGGTITSTPWSTSHTYTAAGTYKIRALIHHANPQGNESGAQIFEQTVIVKPQCNDGIDNDGDGLVDFPTDPGCTSATDDSESPNPATPPVLSGVPTSATIPELSLYTFDANATDSDLPSQTLTFSLVGAPSGASINSSTGVFTWTPTEAQGPGVYNFSVSVSDGSLSDTDPVSLTVTEVNQNPIANSDSVSTNEDDPKGITLNGSDADLPSQSLTYSIVSNPSNGSLSGLNPSTGAVTYTPALNYSGSDSFTFRVTDSYSGQSTPAVISITISSQNDAPQLNAISDKIIDETIPFTFTASGSDVDGDALTYELVGEDNGASMSSVGQFDWTPTEEQGPGVYAFTVSVSDGSTIDTKSFSITVNELNLAPVMSTIGNKSVSETNTLTFSISASDADLPENTLTYSAETLPDGATFDPDTKTFSWTPTFEQAGNYAVTFKVSDGLAEDFEIVPIDVGDVNRSPALNAVGNKTVSEGDALTFGVNGSDPDGDTLTFSAIDLPSGASFDPDTKTFSWTPTFEQAGNYAVTFKVSDGDLSDEETIIITVTEVNRAPVAQDQSVTTDEDVSVGITISASDVDLPPQALIYAVTSPLHGVLSDIDLDAGTMIYTPDLNYNGPDSFTFTANDSQETSNIATVSVTVNSINDAPTITLSGEEHVAVTEGDAFVDDGAVCTDVEDGALSVVVTGSVNTNAVGQYVLKYGCQDENGASDEVTRTVDVQQGPAACMDGKDNDGDGKADYDSENPDPGCSSSADNDETDPVLPQCSDGIDNDEDGDIDYPADSGCNSAEDNNEAKSSGGGGSGYNPNHNSGGQVLGASIGPAVLGEEMCGEYITGYIKYGGKNDPANVSRLQTFLNKYMGLALAVDGVYGKGTYEAVKKFQVKESAEVLNPWVGVTLKGTQDGTGWVYKTTKRWINMIECPKLNIPQLTKDQLTIN